MRSVWAAGLLLRRLRAELGMVLLLFAVIAATSFLFAAAPRLFNRAADDGLRAAMMAATAAQRSLTLADDDRLSPGVDGGVSGVRAVGTQLARRYPATLAALISDRSLSVTTVRLSIGDPPSYDTYLSLRYQDGLTGATRLVSGRWPVSRGVALPPAEWAIGTAAPSGGTNVKPVILEVAVSTAEAPELGVGLGDRLVVTLDGTDRLLARLNTGPMLGRGSLHIVPTEIEVVGLFEPIDPGADYWSADASLLQVTQIGTPLRPVGWAMAYIAAETYPDLWSSGLPFHYEWHDQVDPQRLDGGQVAQLQDDLRHLDFVTGASELGVSGTIVLRTGLPAILDAYIPQIARSASMLSIAAIGPFALAGGVLGMLAILLGSRRRATLALARGRGASGALVLGTQLWEAIILAGAASLLGLLAAVSAIPARASPLSPVLAVAVGGTAVLLLLGATWPMARRPLGLLERDDPPGRRVAPRRLVIDLTIVAIAATAALLLRDRGLTAAEDGDVASFNPLLGAVPVLCGLAAGIVALRAYPLPVRGLGWLAARRRDLVPVLGLRTLGRHPAAANLALLVLMLTAAFGAFSSVVVTSIDRGQGVASYLRVGADYRIERIGTGALAPSLQPAAIAGVEAVAPGIVDPSADFVSVPNQRATIYLEATDPRAYAAVTAGSPDEPAWPIDFLVEPEGTGVGTDRDPIPAILSSRLPLGSADLVPGNTFRITVLGHDLTFRLVERRAGFAGIGEPDPFAVVPFKWIQAALGSPPQPPSVLWLRASEDVAGPLAAAIAAAGGSAHVDSRYDALAALHDAPFVAAISAGYGAAVVVSATYMALAIIGAVVLSAARRNQDLAYLRTLGVTPRQALALTVLEHAPPVLLALPAGAALGVGVAFLLEPGLGLATFVGSSGLPLFVDWTVLALLAAAMIGVAVVAVTAGTWLSLRVRPVDALRIGEH